MHPFVRILVLISLVFDMNALSANSPVIKSPNDDADYAVVELPNRLRALLISNPQTDKAAAAMAVRVGSGADPEEWAGLAHFLEHMLFLGTEKYPRAGEYQAFIRAHGGRQNAFTSFEFTTYFFDIDANHLEPALDRFSQFFVAPLLNPRYVEREVNAVESEYQSRFKDDGRRRSYALKAILNQAHPYSTFQTGNLETLNKPGVRDRLVTFYNEHYSANIMTLVVLGKEPLAELEKWVVSKFSAVENRDVEPLTIDEPLFVPDSLPMQLNIVPNKERRGLTLTFPVTPTRTLYRAKPAYYVGSLLGYEGPGSLLSTLKSRGWADGINAGTGINLDDAATFSIGMALTEKGLDHIDEIVSLVFAQIRNLKTHGVNQWAFDEQRQLADLAFRFQDQADPSDKVLELATSLHFFPAQEVIRAPYLLEDFEPALIQRLIDELTPQRLLLTLVAKDLATNRVTAYFDSPYAVSPIEESRLQLWRSSEVPETLRLPEPNPFIPTDLSLLPEQDNYDVPPAPLLQEPGATLWYKQETSFGAPRADFYASIRTPLANDTARHAVLTRMFTQLVTDHINEPTYPARLAGVYYRLHPQMRGIGVRLSGYNDKQSLLLTTILDAMTAPVIDPERFRVIKERRLRALRNVRLDRPYSQTNQQITRIILEPNWSEDEQIEALETLTPKDLTQFIPQLLAKTSIVALAHGNLSAEEALEQLAQIKERLSGNAKSVDVNRGRVVRLPRGEIYSREVDVDHNDSAYTHYFQAKAKDFESRASMGLLSQILAPEYYREMRTERQLGYIVHVSLATLLETPGVSFIVQSPVAAPEQLRALTESFVSGFSAKLGAMSSEEFEAQKAGFISQLTQTDKTLYERSERWWREISREALAFDTQERLVAATESHDFG